MLLVAIIVFGAAVWGFFQLSRSQRKVASVFATLWLVLLVALCAGPVSGHFVDDPLGLGLMLMSLTGALVAWFVYAVTLAIVRKRAPSEQAFIETRSKVRKVFLLYGGTYVAISLVIRFAIFLYLVPQAHAWESAGVVSFLVPKWPIYIAAILGYHFVARRKTAAAQTR